MLYSYGVISNTEITAKYGFQQTALDGTISYTHGM